MARSILTRLSASRKAKPALKPIKTVAITGATGTLGQPLIAELTVGPRSRPLDAMACLPCTLPWPRPGPPALSAHGPRVPQAAGLTAVPLRRSGQRLSVSAEDLRGVDAVVHLAGAPRRSVHSPHAGSAWGVPGEGPGRN